MSQRVVITANTTPSYRRRPVSSEVVTGRLSILASGRGGMTDLGGVAIPTRRKTYLSVIPAKAGIQ